MHNTLTSASRKRAAMAASPCVKVTIDMRGPSRKRAAIVARITLSIEVSTMKIMPF